MGNIASLPKTSVSLCQIEVCLCLINSVSDSRSYAGWTLTKVVWNMAIEDHVLFMLFCHLSPGISWFKVIGAILTFAFEEASSERKNAFLFKRIIRSPTNPRLTVERSSQMAKPGSLKGWERSSPSWMAICPVSTGFMLLRKRVKWSLGGRESFYFTLYLK